MGSATTTKRGRWGYVVLAACVIAGALWLRLDSLPHDQIMSAIELIGRHVIPHFNDPAGVAPKPEDVLEKIRAMREPEKVDEVPVGGA